MSSYYKVSAPGILSKVANQKRVPTTVTFQVTDRCNYSCSHCYQEHVQNDELPTEKIFEILQELADSGVLFLTLMGGEFFMHPNADAILQRAHDLGFAIKLLSTGHHIHEKRADFLASIRPLQVDMSLYGSKPEIHEEVTRQPGSWKRTYEGAQRLIARKIGVLLKTPVMDHNADDIETLRAMADELGADYSCDPKITSSEAGDQSTTVLRMTGKKVERFYNETMADVMKHGFSKQEVAKLRPLDDVICNAAQGTCFINPRGEVWPCGSLPMKVGDLRTQSFLSVWTESKSMQEIRDLRWADISECNRCEVRDFCNRCHGMALLEQGTLKGPSLEACRHAVTVRDSLRNRGLLSAEHTALPPTWSRVDTDGNHDLKDPQASQRRSLALRILQ